MATFFANEKTEDGAYFSDKVVGEHLIFLLLAAHDTTTSALTMAAYYLAHDQQWQNRLREELQALGKTELEYDDLGHKVPDLDHCFKEVLRMNPPVPMLMRRTVKEVEVGGYQLAPHTMVQISPLYTHRMEQWWTNPHAFDPDRFAREEHKQHSFLWAPFGGGAHKCIGLHFADMLFKCTLSTLLLNYRFALPARSSTPAVSSTFRSPNRWTTCRWCSSPCSLPAKHTPQWRCQRYRGIRKGLRDPAQYTTWQTGRQGCRSAPAAGAPATVPGVADQVPHGEHQQDKCNLTDLDTDVEEQQCQRHVVLRQSRFRQRAGEAHAVQQPKATRQPPGITPQHVVLAAAGKFHRQYKNTQGNSKLHQGHRVIEETQRHQRQGNTVAHGEGGNRPQQSGSTAHQQQQTENEQQVIYTTPDMFYTQQGVIAHHVAGTGLLRHNKFRLFGVEYLLVLAAIEQAYHNHG